MNSWTTPRLSMSGGPGWNYEPHASAPECNELGALLVAAGLGRRHAV